jgi:hypothetical protein
MSRGHGKLQTTLLSIIAENDRLLDTFELTALAFDIKPDQSGRCIIDDAHLSSARRALAKLAREGAIAAASGHFRHGRVMWSSHIAYAAYREKATRAFGDGRFLGAGLRFV